MPNPLHALDLQDAVKTEPASSDLRRPRWDTGLHWTG